MTVLQLLLSDVRQIRAGLVAGWLWLIFIWLAAPGAVPTPEYGGIFGQVYALGDRIGVVGCFVVGSLAAYALGSLLYALESALIDRVQWPKGRTPSAMVKMPSFGTEEVLALTTDPDYGRDREWLSRRLLSRTEAKARDLIDTAIADARSRLSTAVLRCGSREFLLRAAGRDYLDLLVPGHAEALVLPILPTAQRVLEERNLLRMRLADGAPEASTRIERLYSEADLRLAVFPPLFGIGLLAGVDLHPGHGMANLVLLGMIAASVGLAAHGILLRSSADEQLIDAIRTRHDALLLSWLTPIFARYNERACTASDQLSAMKDAPRGSQSA